MNHTKIKTNRGMTYVELIVVLSIFAIMSSIISYNYQAFQAKVDIKSLATDVAQKIVEAQKSAIAGKLTPGAAAGWKPAYGIYYNSFSNKSLIFFADLNQTQKFEGTDCTGECLQKITINKNFYITDVATDVVVQNGTQLTPVTDLGIVFTRPSSEAKFSSGGSLLSNVVYAQITISTVTASPLSIIKIFPSGKVQVN